MSLDQPMCFFTGANGNRLAADTWGRADAPVVVFLHGGGQTRHAWGRTAEAVGAAGWYSIALDLRGHGDSDWSADGRYGGDGFCGDVAALIAELGRPIIGIGASLGGVTLLRHSGRTGENAGVRGLALVDIAPKMEPAGVQRVLQFMSARPDGFANLEEAAEAVSQYLPARQRTGDNSGLRKNLRQRDDGRLVWHWDPKLLNFDGDAGLDVLEEMRDAAAGLKVPTLLVRGKLSDVISEDSVKDFLALVPHADFVDVGQAGHMVAGDRNDAFSGAILEWLHRHFPLSTPI